MKKIGRPSTRPQLRVINPIVIQRPQPIPGMTRYSRVVWKRIVDSHDPDHFKPGMLEQLRIFCEACSSHKKAIIEIRKTGEILTQDNKVTKRNPWCLERDACAAVMSSISTKLQLNVNSTKQAGEAPKPKSKREGLIFKG
ncbi:MAG: P27 family phage terminase small subunit [Deltaproteobacteria bacterium]|uniref:P27 family phage terminase small subunit n=1 Tax=Desulfobacula sp. TaxID=2593537 RepID=UPI001985FA2A|nr:P27 family phage terminase small subunit [Candidatus Desulfobacula maris]MBL6994790.1 P27 family phage terminase small subunit [Desulfobacula sp.]